MNRVETIRAVVWLDQLAAKAKDEAGKLRADLVADARAEYEEQGTPPTWRPPDLATVAARVSHETAYVADEAAFAAWVQSRYPTEADTRVVVRQAWQELFLKSAATSGEVVVDTATGEVVPGLKVRPGGEFLGITISASPLAKQVMGALAEHGLRRLAAEASPEAPVVLAVAGG